ncbi:MAG: hypothetical protein P4L49_17935 [Desulfosporosinus sp.]|nr:hypothetical protein [Desulfosporosinus sp.]
MLSGFMAIIMLVAVFGIVIVDYMHQEDTREGGQGEQGQPCLSFSHLRLVK